MAMSVDEISANFVKNDMLINDCSKFVRAVAERVGGEYARDLKTFVAGNADDICGRFNKMPFIWIGNHGAVSGATATQKANDGQFVLGGLGLREWRQCYEAQLRRQSQTDYKGQKTPEGQTFTMGHVVVIAPGGPSRNIENLRLKNGKVQPCRGGYPYCYQGAHLSQYRFSGRTQVDAVFPWWTLGNIAYAYIEIKK